MINKPVITKLQWDTDFFNKEIGQIVINNIDELSVVNSSLIDNQYYDLIYIYSTTEVDLYKAQLIDKKVRLVVNKSDLLTFGNYTHPLITEYSSPFASEQLLNLVYESGQHSRFLLDNNLGRYYFEKLYQTWIERSIKKEIAQSVYVSIENENITGFVTIGVNNNEMNIGLIATDIEMRGKGIGKSLIYRVFHDFIISDCDTLSVYTQLNNEVACNFYKKCGFKLENVEFIYHYWK